MLTTLTTLTSLPIFPIFLRLLFCSFIIHFYDLSTQVLSCGGSKGLSPVHVQLKACTLANPTSWKRWYAIKTLFWINDQDWFIQLIPRLGIFTSVLGLVGYHSNLMFLINFIIYHSLDVVFYDGFCFPWENLLFEATFISIFAPTLTPWTFAIELNPFTTYVVWSYRWLLFRLMFGFGKTKFLDDSNTTDNSLYIYNFLFAQPMPNKFAKWITDTIPKSKWIWKGM